MAAGLTIREENLPALADAFLHEAFADSDPKLWEPVLSVDAELDLQRATWALQDALEAMGPFGIGNPEPVFVARGLRATGVRALNKGGIRMDLQGPGGQRIKAVGFGLGIEPADVEGLVDVAFSLQTNFWRGRSTLELRLRDLRLAE